MPAVSLLIRPQWLLGLRYVHGNQIASLESLDQGRWEVEGVLTGVSAHAEDARTTSIAVIVPLMAYSPSRMALVPARGRALPSTRLVGAT